MSDLTFVLVINFFINLILALIWAFGSEPAESKPEVFKKIFTFLVIFVVGLWGVGIMAFLYFGFIQIRKFIKLPWKKEE